MATINVFAKSEAEMWGTTPQPKPARSIDSIVVELNTLRTDEAANLRSSQFYVALNQIVEFLADARANRIAELEAKHEELVTAARKAGHEVFIMEQQTIKISLADHAKLDAAKVSARDRLEQLQHEAKLSNPRLMTRLEKLQQENAIRDAQEKAQSTAMAESLFAEEHNRLLPKLRELKAKHADATNAATTVAEEIERLQRLQ